MDRFYCSSCQSRVLDEYLKPVKYGRFRWKFSWSIRQTWGVPTPYVRIVVRSSRVSDVENSRGQSCPHHLVNLLWFGYTKQSAEEVTEEWVGRECRSLRGVVAEHQA